MLTTFAKPKVNLFLHVTGRREDGYHLLESLVVFPDGGDEVTVEPDENLVFSVSGPYSGKLGAEEDNLVLKAARRLMAETEEAPGVRITLIKNLPVAAGIGGGSADAAAALFLLNQHWKIGMTPAELEEIGLEIGADVPACLRGTPLIMRGIGEILEPVTGLPQFHVLLINPGVELSTPAVFALRKSVFSETDPLTDIPGSVQDLTDWLSTRTNDLQSPALELAPEIGDVLDRIAGLPGCLLARMSGSGATCFGIFPSREEAEQGIEEIKSTQPAWWASAHTV